MLRREKKREKRRKTKKRGDKGNCVGSGEGIERKGMPRRENRGRT